MSKSRNWRIAVAVTAGWEFAAAASNGRWPYITDLVRPRRLLRNLLPAVIAAIVWDHFQADERRRIF